MKQRIRAPKVLCAETRVSVLDSNATIAKLEEKVSDVMTVSFYYFISITGELSVQKLVVWWLAPRKFSRTSPSTTSENALSSMKFMFIIDLTC